MVYFKLHFFFFDRLWCICKQPHNNRFMICCDKCEEWFHGKCVSITKAMGQQMEEKGVEWTCPNCIKKRNIQLLNLVVSFTDSIHQILISLRRLKYKNKNCTFINNKFRKTLINSDVIAFIKSDYV